jgi:DNA-binding NarL/FixJ family response regulator
VGLVAIADAASPSGRALLAALDTIGPVFRTEHGGDGTTDVLHTNNHNNHYGPAEGGVSEVPVLTNLLPEQRALLGRLANGETIATAAAAEYLSLRTANRRIAQARSQLGVRTTREAVIVFLRQRRPE